MSDKDKVHQYLERRKEDRKEHKPIPIDKEIKREMGWDLLEQQRIEQERRRLRK